uniref:Transposase n=1 Tax=Ascaris lumbricoides TaxID=6252 RepID=A0A0M3HZB4_ASCLU
MKTRDRKKTNFEIADYVIVLDYVSQGTNMYCTNSRKVVISATSDGGAPIEDNTSADCPQHDSAANLRDDGSSVNGD